MTVTASTTEKSLSTVSGGRQYWNKTRIPSIFDFELGPEANISDSLFSIIIFIYVSVTFTYVFYAFCFNSKKHSPPAKPRRDVESLEGIIDEE